MERQLRKHYSDVGSPVTVITPEGKEEVNGEIIEFQLNKRLSYTWKTPEEDASKTTTVVFELQEMGPMTKLTIPHDMDVEMQNSNRRQRVGRSFYAD
jgi:uncharacterized protein YndB with AHSA1/START domain